MKPTFTPDEKRADAESLDVFRYERFLRSHIGGTHEIPVLPRSLKGLRKLHAALHRGESLDH